MSVYGSKESVKGGEVRVFLVDDHPFIREGLISSLSDHEDLIVCGEAASAEAALRQVPKVMPDVIVTDLTLEGKSGLQLIGELKCLHPKIPVIVLSMHNEKIYGSRALQAGARGYVRKSDKISRLIKAIRKVHAGRLYISEELSEFLLQGVSPLRSESGKDAGINSLTPREFEVFRFLGQGRNPQEIAHHLSVSIKTINTHRSNIVDKLGLSSFNDLIVYAVRWLDLER